MLRIFQIATILLLGAELGFGQSHREFNHQHQMLRNAIVPRAAHQMQRSTQHSTGPTAIGLSAKKSSNKARKSRRVHQFANRWKRQDNRPVRLPALPKSNDDLLADNDDLLLDDDTELLPTPKDIPSSDDDDLLADDDDLLADDDDELLADDDDDLLADDDDELTNEERKGDDDSSGDKSEADSKDRLKLDPHLELLSKNRYPSAKECGKCHEQHYREWSVSGHAYSTISPMFRKFEQKINDLSQGTIGYFCQRCHAPVAVALGNSRDQSPWDSIPAAHEGVTCIACHRVIESYGKVNGERRIEEGPITAPVVGALRDSKLHEVIAKKDHYKIKLSPDEKGPGQVIHNRTLCFEQISSSHFCISCHQVAVFPGIKLEIVGEQYRASPACKQGISCQDCHMGAEPGKPNGYERGPTAVISGKKVNPNARHSNHIMWGPGYSVAHPGIFPFNPKADDWSPYEWLKFDWRSGWGTKDFEKMLEDGAIDARFPKIWEESDDRMDAREVIDENLKLLAEKKLSRFILMESGSKVDGPIFTHTPRVGMPLSFRYIIRNLNSGHHLPSGSLGAQPQIWLNVALTDPCGNRLWESGYVDANGDVADMHSLEVAAGRIKRDQQLFNLQTKFLITHVKGPDREMYLPINTDFDQLPFIRPSGFPITNMNHPPFIRLETHSIPPLGKKAAKYIVPGRLIKEPGRYRLSVRMRSRAEPIYFMRFCGASPESERGMNERMLDFHQHTYEFIVR